jgi:transposase
MAAALGYHATDPDRGPRLCFQLQPDPYTSVTLIQVLTQLRGFYTGERVVLIWDGLGAHRSRTMRDWLATQTDWLTVEQLPTYAPDLNPVEGLWANLKTVELANFTVGFPRDLAAAGWALAACSRAAQHLPEHIEDPAVLARVAAMVKMALSTSTKRHRRAAGAGRLGNARADRNCTNRRHHAGRARYARIRGGRSQVD